MPDILTVPTTVENTGFKGLLATLWQRIILSYKTTLIGIAVEALALVADNMVHSPNKVITIIGSVVAWGLIFLKEQGIVKPPAA